jgi:hypothetical protein
MDTKSLAQCLAQSSYGASLLDCRKRQACGALEITWFIIPGVPARLVPGKVKPKVQLGEGAMRNNAESVLAASTDQIS